MYICMCTHTYMYVCVYTHKKNPRVRWRDKNGGEKSDTTGDNQGECLALLELQNAEDRKHLPLLKASGKGLSSEAE